MNLTYSKIILPQNQDFYIVLRKDSINFTFYTNQAFPTSSNREGNGPSDISCLQNKSFHRTATVVKLVVEVVMRSDAHSIMENKIDSGVDKIGFSGFDCNPPSKPHRKFPPFANANEICNLFSPAACLKSYSVPQCTPSSFSIEWVRKGVGNFWIIHKTCKFN